MTLSISSKYSLLTTHIARPSGRVCDNIQTDCQLSVAALSMSLGLCFWHNFSGMKRTCWDNWQLAVLPQSGGSEFDPRRVHDNLSVPLWVYMHFPVPEHQNWTNKYMYMCVCVPCVFADFVIGQVYLYPPGSLMIVPVPAKYPWKTWRYV